MSRILRNDASLGASSCTSQTGTRRRTSRRQRLILLVNMCEIILHVCEDCRKTSMVDMNHCEPVRKLLSDATGEVTKFEIHQAFIWSPLEGCDSLLIHPTVQSSPCSIHRPRAPRTIEEPRRRTRFLQANDPNSSSVPTLGGRRHRARRTASNSDLASNSPSNSSSSLDSGSTPIINPPSAFPARATPLPPYLQPPPLDNADSNMVPNLSSMAPVGGTLPSIWRRGGLFTQPLGSGFIGRSTYHVNISSDNSETVEALSGWVDEGPNRSQDEV